MTAIKDKQEIRVKRRTEETLQLWVYKTMPAKYNTQHSRQQYEHMKHQKKQGLHQMTV